MEGAREAGEYMEKWAEGAQWGVGFVNESFSVTVNDPLQRFFWKAGVIAWYLSLWWHYKA